jgi:hypothetical protein
MYLTAVNKLRMIMQDNVKAPISTPSAVWITLTHFATAHVLIFSGTNYCHVTIRT